MPIVSHGVFFIFYAYVLLGLNIFFWTVEALSEQAAAVSFT